MTNQSLIFLELLKVRGVPEDQARIASDLFDKLTAGERIPEPRVEVHEETVNDFLRELIERMLLLPVQMFLDRLPPEQKEKLKGKIGL